MFNLLMISVLPRTLLFSCQSTGTLASDRLVWGGICSCLHGCLVAHQLPDQRLLVVAVAPLVKVHEVFNRQARQPASGFEFRFGKEVADIADTQVSNRSYAPWDAESLLQGGLVENADPADAQTLGSRRQPEVLYGTDAAV